VAARAPLTASMSIMAFCRGWLARAYCSASRCSLGSPWGCVAALPAAPEAVEWVEADAAVL
jgi:hypothetical protein